MSSPLLAHVSGLVDRVAPTLLALQDTAQPARGTPAQSGGGGGGGGGGSMFGGFLIPLLMVAFLYFFMFRPMRKQKAEAETLNKSLQKGDRVVTTSGIVGTITGLEEQFITLEVSEKVRVKFLREAVTKKLVDAAARGGEKSSATAVPADAKK